MTEFTLVEQILRLGAYGLVILFVVMHQRGDVVWRREVERSDREHAADVDALKAQLVREREQGQAQITHERQQAQARHDEMKTFYETLLAGVVRDRDEWKQFAQQGFRAAGQATDVAARIVEQGPR